MHCILYALLFLAFTVHAQTIYKYIDEQGNITYSQEPPPGQEVEIIETPPEPSKEEVEAAQEREKKNEKSPDAMDKDKQEPEKDPESIPAENAEISMSTKFVGGKLAKGHFQ